LTQTAVIRTRAVLGRTALVVTMALLMFPIYWLIQSAFSTQEDLVHEPVYFFPPHPTLEPLRSAWNLVSHGLLNSLTISLGTVVLTLVIAILGAHGIALARSRGGSVISRMMVLLGLVFPTIAFVIPLDLLLYRLHLLDTYVGVVLADSLYAIPLGVVVLYTYMTNIPRTLLEAATVDGASSFRILRSVVVPLSIPAIATTAILAFLFAWSDFLFAATFLSDEQKLPASIVIYDLLGGTSTQIVDWPEVMAASLLLALPAMIAIGAAHHYIRTGLGAGAVKS
jgi:multiple sugar transport system permease protein